MFSLCVVNDVIITQSRTIQAPKNSKIHEIMSYKWCEKAFQKNLFVNSDDVFLNLNLISKFTFLKLKLKFYKRDYLISPPTFSPRYILATKN